jgi:hypothetical protein
MFGMNVVLCLLFLCNFNHSLKLTNKKVTNIKQRAFSQNSIDVKEDRSPQVLSVKDPQTGVTVKLIGCMHYNPYSVNMAAEIVEDLAKSGKLVSVLVESCPKRWEKMQGRSPLLKKLLSNEMQTASDIAAKYGYPTILGKLNQINLLSLSV